MAYQREGSLRGIDGNQRSEILGHFKDITANLTLI